MKKIILVAAVVMSLYGCKKFVETPLPVDGLSGEQVFTSESKATASVAAIYGYVINNPTFASFRTTIYGGLSSDELVRFNASLDQEQVNSNQLLAGNAEIATIWITAYKTIFFANAVYAGITASKELAESVKDKLAAECRFIRAFSYFYLVNFFGDVPLIKGTDYKENGQMPRTSKQDVYDFIIKELKEVKEILPVSYDGNEKVRPNKWAAVSLLARIFLYKEQWEDAEKEASEVINAGIYTPLGKPADVFLKSSKEAIWQLMPMTGTLQERQQFRVTLSAPSNYLRSELVNTFEPGDLRRAAWIDSTTYASVKYYYPSKYKNSSATINEYYVIFRLPELLLIRAEARARLDKLPEAIDDLNIIRSRAGILPLEATLDKPAVLLAVEKERRLEFMSEWGHRWFDLVRTSRAGEVIGNLKNTWQDSDMLYPIPEKEIIANINLTQNPGY